MINPFKKIAVLIPTLGRHQNMWRVIANLQENTDPSLFTPYFIVENTDTNSINTANDLGVLAIINEGEPCYADCINTAYRKTNEPFLFLGADDLGFQRGWAENALSHMKPGVGVCGTNDLGGIEIGHGRDATHFLVSRHYIQTLSGRVDMPDVVLYPYSHNYCDKEFVETARSRHAYVYCPKAIVEHIHPAWGKGKWDQTYDKGQKTDWQDREIYRSRQHLWSR